MEVPGYAQSRGKRKVIITCAVTGNAPVHPRYPYEYPVTPKQICDAVAEAASAGAAVAHIHVRDPHTGDGSGDPKLFCEVVDRIRQRGTNILINLTAGLGGLFLPDPEDEARALPESDMKRAEERVEHLRQCLPDIASLDVTTGNQAEGSLEFIYMNSTRTIRRMAKLFQEYGVKPELEMFQPGDVLLANSLVKEGLIDGTPLYQMVLGVRWACPADTPTMIYMKSLIPPNVNWAAFGISRQQMPMVAQSVLLGGNVRVGLEDNLYLDRGVFAKNGQLVERAVSLIELIGEQVATPEEAKSILGIGAQAQPTGES